MNDQEALERAIQAIQMGDRTTGKHLLAAILRSDPAKVQAWLWMSDVVDTDTQRLDCLRRVLSLDPDNETAKARMVTLTGPEGPRDAQLAANREGDPGLSRLAKLRNGESETGLSGRRPVSARLLVPSGGHAAADLERPLSDRRPPLQSVDAETSPKVAPLDAAARTRGRRNIMIAGMLTLTLICGLLLLIVTALALVS